ncbi:MAG: hypothetical protein GY865_05545, partial [candidate division Zixibacteria bacterium]|nr:hypothetical protein [candidate division Zixibacteria bacterium]
MSILRYNFKESRILQFMDKKAPLDPSRNGLIQCKAIVIVITYILFNDLQLYRLWKLTNETAVADNMPPGFDPEEYFDHRPRDAVVLYICDIGNEDHSLRGLFR